MKTTAPARIPRTAPLLLDRRCFPDDVHNVHDDGDDCGEELSNAECLEDARVSPLPHLILIFSNMLSVAMSRFNDDSGSLRGSSSDIVCRKMAG